MSATAHPRGVAEMIPIEHQTSDRVVRTMVFAVPPAALVVGGWLAWGGALHWQDLLVLAITYTLTGLGVTVGYHRLFTHRSFKTTRPLRALLAVLGSMAVEGPVDEWVATHRKHHRFSDHPGDPHSPHVDHAPGWRGALRGLAHAHTSAGCCAARRWPTPAAMQRTCSPTVTCASSAAPSRSGWRSDSPSRSASASPSPEPSREG
jgi:stearoyl-CoA desaturase (delta-9 desaturase)